MNESYARLKEYAQDLKNRLDAQQAWHERNPGISPFRPDQYTDDLHETDPYPFTNDIISAQRFHDLIILSLSAYEKGDNAK